MIAGQSGITGVAEESDFAGTFQLIQSLKPDTTRILVIGNPSDSSREKRRSFEDALPKLPNRYTFEYYEDWTDAELIQRVSTLPDGTVGLILDVTVDVNGHYNYRDASFTHALATAHGCPSSSPPSPREKTTGARSRGTAWGADWSSLICTGPR
ncbi:MAG: hypothetical protein IPL39_21685 [Opitutaceae bacterium]|nr:hypothetical protein [Opitutaceae bacterium]